MVVGGADRRVQPQCVRHSGASIQVAAPPRPSRQASQPCTQSTGTQTVLRVAGNRGAKIAGGQRRAGPTSARQVHEPRRVEWERGITRSTEVPQLKGVANFHCQVLKFRAPAAFEPMTPGWYRQAGKSPKRAFPSSSPPPGAHSPCSITFPPPRESSNQTFDRRGALNPAQRGAQSDRRSRCLLGRG